MTAHELAYLFAAITLFSTLSGGIMALRYSAHLHLILGFSAGVLISMPFFDLLPESLDLLKSASLGERLAFILVPVAFFFFHALQKFVLFHASHDQEEISHQHVGKLGASGLIIHSLLDGVAIGTGFQASEGLGILMAMAVILHDVSDGVSTVGILLANRHNPRQTWGWLLADAAAPLLGVFATGFFQLSAVALGGILAVFAGFFLYMGASDLLPEAYRHKNNVSTLAMALLGMVFILVATQVLG